MADQYDNNNSGALFKNGDKQEGDNRPDYKGPCEVNGVPMRVAAWVKSSKAGDRYMSLSFEPPYEGEKGKPAAPGANLPEPEDIPF